MKVPFGIWTVLCTGLQLVSATGWVALTGLTASDYQTNFNYWVSAPYELRLTCVSGYDTGAGARFAAIWTKQSGPGYAAGHMMTAAQFNTANASYQGQSYDPVFISGFTSGGIRYYNAIWEYNPRAPEVVVQIEMDGAAMAGAALGKAIQGYTLTYVTTFTSAGQDYYAAIWTFGSISTAECSFGRTASQYQSDFNTLTAQGFRLTAVTTSVEAGTSLYSAVFRKTSGGAWYNYAGISSVNYSGETLNAYYTGYRPSFVSVYTNSGTLYNATWTHNGGLSPSAAQPIHEAMSDYMSSNAVPGLSLAIARNGRLVFAKGFGLADQGAGTWVHPNHRFRVASISKPITAAAMMRLRDGVGGSLSSINSTVFGSGTLLGTTYGTNAYGTSERAITVRQLLNHTTGWTDDGQLWNNAYGTDHAAIIGWHLDNRNPASTPGTSYQYQNIDYCVAGRIIERLSSLTYEQYVQDYLLEQCGITGMELGNKTLAGRKLNEVVYYPTPGGDDPYVTIDPHRMDANGGWIARPIDLLLFIRRIDGLNTPPDVISANRFADMQTGSTPNMGYGLGTVINSGWFGHNGCMDGTVSFLVHRNDGFDYAVVCNLRPNNDSCGWNLRAAVDAAINAVPGSAWPDWDLFPSVSPDYDAWAVAKYPASLRSQLGLKEDLWGQEADFDGDGIPGLMEAYFNLDPLAPSTLPFRALRDNGDFVVRWRRSIFSPVNGVQLKAVRRSNLSSGSWVDGPEIQSVATGVFGFTDYETRIPFNSASRVFQRFQATGQ